MASSISAITTGGGGLVSTGDASGNLDLKSGTTTMVAITSTGVDVTGDLKFNSGYGSIATAYGCRAWVNFNGTGTVAIRASGNVSSITDIGTGNYAINMTTALSDAYYAVAGFGNQGSGDAAPNGCISLENPQTITTSSFRIVVGTPTVGGIDREYVNVAVFR